MNVECFGEVIECHQYKKYVFIVCLKNEEYALIIHNRVLNSTQLLAKTHDFELINFIIREKIRQL